MKTNKFIVFFVVLFIGITAVTLTTNKKTSLAQEFDEFVYLPLVITPDPAIIVGHQHTDASQIPDFWIEQARQYVVHYAHTSHGSQVLSGLRWLEARMIVSMWIFRLVALWFCLLTPLRCASTTAIIMLATLILLQTSIGKALRDSRIHAALSIPVV